MSQLKISAWMALAFGLVVTSNLYGFDHAAFDDILKAYVSSGRVNYTAIKAGDMPKLRQYLTSLGRADPESFESDEERLAFWINAYNAMTIMGVLERYPVETISPTKLGIIPDNSFFKETTFTINGKELSVDDIEHVILRKKFSEARIHFAIVCASGGCPELRSEAYTGERVKDQLDDQARRFINNPEKIRIDIANRKVYLSRIFQWFPQDFKKAPGMTVIKFISRYVDEEKRKFLNTRKFDIDYLDYSWGLNDIK